MKSSGKSLPSVKKQEEILKFFLANIKTAELKKLLAEALKRKRTGLPIRSSLKTAPADLSRFYVYSNSFESMMNHLAHVPPFSSIFPDTSITAPLLMRYGVPAADNSGQNAYPGLDQWISFALVHMYYRHFGFPLEIFQDVVRLFYKVHLAPTALHSPGDVAQHHPDDSPEFVQLAEQWLAGTTNDSRLEEFESKYIESLATSVPLLWSILLRPIDEFASSSAENRALELVRSGAYDEAADSFRALSNTEQSELRHCFNLAYCLSLIGNIEEALATTQGSLRAQLRDPSSMPGLKKRKERFEFGATCYLTAQLGWQQGKYTMAAEWLDLLERSVGINLIFARDLRLLARLASRSTVLSSDLENLHPMLGPPSLHLTICTAFSLRSAGRLDLLQPLLEARASLPVQELLKLWKQAVLPPESLDDLVSRLLTDGARTVTAVEASSHEAAEAASSQPGPVVQAHEHAEDSNDLALPRSGSAVESPPSWEQEPLEVDVAQPVRIALDCLLTINRRRSDRLTALQSLLDCFDSEAFKQWHEILNKLDNDVTNIDEAFAAFKSASLADLHHYEQVTECLIELGRRSSEDRVRLRQKASEILSATRIGVLLAILERCGSQSEAYRSAVSERDEAVVALLEGIRRDVDTIPGDEEIARQIAVLPPPTEVLRREDIRRIYKVRATIAEQVRKHTEERERQEKLRQVESLVALAQHLTDTATPEQLDMVSALIEQFARFDYTENAQTVAAAWLDIVPAMRGHACHDRGVERFIDAIRLLIEAGHPELTAAAERLIKATAETGWNASELSILAAEGVPSVLYEVVRGRLGHPAFETFVQAVAPRILEQVPLAPGEALQLIAEISSRDRRQQSRILAKAIPLLITVGKYGMALVLWSSLYDCDEASAVSIEPDVPLLYFVVADAQIAEHAQELVPLLDDVFTSEYVYRRYGQSMGFCLTLATAACWYAAQLDMPHWSACTKTFLSPIHEVFPHTCQLLGSFLERPANPAVGAKPCSTMAVRDLPEPYATELARAAQQIMIERANIWLRDTLTRIYEMQIN
jgi:hypothetical protein